MESPAGAQEFNACKAFSIVRNPIDSTISMSNLLNTMSHSLQVNEKYQDFPVFWKGLLSNATK
jgi:hypothetical protein